VLTIRVNAESSASPEQVLESARDFSSRRAKVWMNARPKYLKVHESGEDFADVTEGTWIVGRFWERNRYDWSQPGSVKATVSESNIFEPGTTWEIRATPRNGGSAVEMTLNRTFRRGPKGRIAAAVNHTLGKWVMWGWYLRHALRAIEKQQVAT
jgi:hypothetical protein